MDEYIANYDQYATADNIINSYGGQLEVASINMDQYGELSIKFNRGVHYDQTMVEQYMPDYQEEEIVVEPTDEEILEVTQSVTETFIPDIV